MSKVFITKYPTSVNNDKLPVYGKIKIGINVSSPADIGTFQVDSPIDAIGGNFLQEDLSTVIGSHIDKHNDKLYVDSNVSGILINKYGLNGQLYLNNGNNIYNVDISEFRYSKLLFFQIVGKDVTGDIGSLSSMTQLTNLYLANTSVTGDISSLSSNKSIKAIYINCTNITGDISSLSSMTQLTSLNIIGNRGITCDISSLSSMTQLTNLNISDTRGITGDISSLSSMNQLLNLNVANTSVTGDISSIVNNLTALKTLTIPLTITITDEQKTTLTNRGCTVTIK